MSVGTFNAHLSTHQENLQKNNPQFCLTGGLVVIVPGLLI